MTLDEFNGLLRELGFEETQAAGNWRWYEFPGPHARKNWGIQAIVRVQAYAQDAWHGGKLVRQPEFDVSVGLWLWGAYGWQPARPGAGLPHDFGRVREEGYVSTPEELVALIKPMAEARRVAGALRAAFDKALRLSPSVERLMTAVRHDPNDEGRVLVLADALQEAGVPF